MPAPDTLALTLLDTEARIISEDDTHAVIAIRIEKSTLRAFLQRNGHFLAALGELAPIVAPARKPCRQATG